MQLLFVYLQDTRRGLSAAKRDVAELWQLVESMGDAQVMDIIMQKGEEFAATYIGPGKVREIAEYLKKTPIDVIVFNGQLTPGQKFNLTKRFWDTNPNIIVWDRVDLILAIFTKHAHTKEALLQIELARMRHMGPAIFGMGKVLSRQGGGVGTRGIGETNTELMKRHWRREIKRVTDALEKITLQRTRQIDRRRQLGLTSVSLVGYTNAGKTSLFNALTHKKKYVRNELFATLDSAVGEVFVQELNRPVIVSDTIGFIQNLPPQLIDAFKSTLLESVNADVVLHVIDAADPQMEQKIRVVEDILRQLEIPEEKVLHVYNKMDIAADKTRSRLSHMDRTFLISTKTGEGVDDLLPSCLSKRENENAV